LAGLGVCPFVAKKEKGTHEKVAPISKWVIWLH
jgi:hypothetical protein